MSRIFVRVISDRKSRVGYGYVVSKHLCANEHVEIELYYGSKKQSKKFAYIRGYWFRGQQMPELEVTGYGNVNFSIGRKDMGNEPPCRVERREK